MGMRRRGRKECHVVRHQVDVDGDGQNKRLRARATAGVDLTDENPHRHQVLGHFSRAFASVASFAVSAAALSICRDDASHAMTMMNGIDSCQNVQQLSSNYKSDAEIVEHFKKICALLTETSPDIELKKDFLTAVFGSSWAKMGPKQAIRVITKDKNIHWLAFLHRIWDNLRASNNVKEALADSCFGGVLKHDFTDDYFKTLGFAQGEPPNSHPVSFDVVIHEELGLTVPQPNNLQFKSPLLTPSLMELYGALRFHHSCRPQEYINSVLWTRLDWGNVKAIFKDVNSKRFKIEDDRLGHEDMVTISSTLKKLQDICETVSTGCDNVVFGNVAMATLLGYFVLSNKPLHMDWEHIINHKGNFKPDDLFWTVAKSHGALAKIHAMWDDLSDHQKTNDIYTQLLKYMSVGKGFVEMYNDVMKQRNNGTDARMDFESLRSHGKSSQFRLDWASQKQFTEIFNFDAMKHLEVPIRSFDNLVDFYSDGVVPTGTSKDCECFFDLPKIHKLGEECDSELLYSVICDYLEKGGAQKLPENLKVEETGPIRVQGKDADNIWTIQYPTAPDDKMRTPRKTTQVQLNLQPQVFDSTLSSSSGASVPTQQTVGNNQQLAQQRTATGSLFKLATTPTSNQEQKPLVKEQSVEQLPVEQKDENVVCIPESRISTKDKKGLLDPLTAILMFSGPNNKGHRHRRHRRRRPKQYRALRNTNKYSADTWPRKVSSHSTKRDDSQIVSSTKRHRRTRHTIPRNRQSTPKNVSPADHPHQLRHNRQRAEV